MILPLLTYALLAGVAWTVCLSTWEGETLHSLKRDDNGKCNPMLPYWVVLSLVHVGIYYGWSWLMFQWGILRLHDGQDTWWFTGIFVAYYWAAFEAFYVLCHLAQHRFRWFANLTGHKGDLSEKFHHGMKPPFGPDYLTAFSAHPMDSFVVQFAGQSPWLWLWLGNALGAPEVRASALTFGIPDVARVHWHAGAQPPVVRRGEPLQAPRRPFKGPVLVLRHPGTLALLQSAIKKKTINNHNPTSTFSA